MCKPNIAYSVGTIHKSNRCGYFKVTEYVNSKHIEIEFLSTGYKATTGVGSIKSGSVKDFLTSSVVGKGYVGDGEYAVSVKGKITTAYRRWSSMLARCYDTNAPAHAYYGAKGVTVDPSWYNFQVFATWYYEQCGQLDINPDCNNYDIDKDINHSGSKPKQYGPSCCVLVSKSTNRAEFEPRFVAATVEANKTEFRFRSPDGCIHKGTNIAEFCREQGLTRSCMSRVKNGRMPSHKGWTKV